MLQQDGLLEITVGTNGGAIVRGVSLASAAQPRKVSPPSGSARSEKSAVSYGQQNISGSATRSAPSRRASAQPRSAF